MKPSKASGAAASKAGSQKKKKTSAARAAESNKPAKTEKNPVKKETSPVIRQTAKTASKPLSPNLPPKKSKEAAAQKKKAPRPDLSPVSMPSRNFGKRIPSNDSTPESMMESGNNSTTFMEKLSRLIFGEKFHVRSRDLIIAATLVVLVLLINTITIYMMNDQSTLEDAKGEASAAIAATDEFAETADSLTPAAGPADLSASEVESTAQGGNISTKTKGPTEEGADIPLANIEDQQKAAPETSPATEATKTKEAARPQTAALPYTTKTRQAEKEAVAPQKSNAAERSTENRPAGSDKEKYLLEILSQH